MLMAREVRSVKRMRATLAILILIYPAGFLQRQPRPEPAHSP